MDDTKSEAEQKEEIKLKIVGAFNELEKPKPKVEDGWHVMVDPGEEFGGNWPVGIVKASFKEFAEAFSVKPWVLGASHSGADKGKVMLQFGVKDPNDKEWTFSSQYRLDRVDENESTLVWWQIKSTDDVINVGQFLANRFGRPVSVQGYLGDGSLHAGMCSRHSGSLL
jgi:hypothetical protein